MSKTTFLTFVQTAPGLEALLRQEVESLLGPGGGISEQVGGVSVRVDRAQLFQLCLASRLAESVRIRLKSFIARDFHALEEGLVRLPWAAYLPPGSVAETRVVCHRSRLWHTGAVTERISALLERRFQVGAGRAEEGASQIHLRITGDAVQVSVDAGGFRLHRRGVRKISLEASVRETIAAATVAQILQGELGPKPVIWDPFCGAGTLGLEAFLLGRGLLPGSWRRFAFEAWPTHDPELLVEVKAQLSERFAQDAPYPGLQVLFSDRDIRAIRAAEQNTQSAGLDPFATFLCASVEDAAPQVPPGALVVANPPYGKRLAEEDAIRSLLRVLERRPDLRPVALLVGGTARKQVPAQFRAALRTRSGGENVSVRLLGPGEAPS